MDLPEETKLRYLRAELRRGRIFWFRTTLLRDPTVVAKAKFAVVVSCAIENDDVMFIYTTSHVEDYRSGRFAAKMAHETLFCPVGSYACFTVETAIPIRTILTEPLSRLAGLSWPSDFKVHDQLNEADTKMMDTIMAKTRNIEVRYKQRCLPGAVR